MPKMRNYRQIAELVNEKNSVVNTPSWNSLKPLRGGHWMKMLFNCNYFWDYFQTDFWKTVTERVLREKGRICLKCKDPMSSFIFTKSFKRKTLVGEDTSLLFPCCSKCYAGLIPKKIQKNLKKSAEKKLVGKYYI